MAVTITGAATYFAGSMVLSPVFSVEAWVKSTQEGTGRVLSMDGITNRLFQFGLVDGKFWASVAGSSASIYSGSSVTSVNDGEWHHLVLVVTSSTFGRARDAVCATDMLDASMSTSTREQRSVLDAASLQDVIDVSSASANVLLTASTSPDASRYESRGLLYVDGVLETTLTIYEGVTQTSQTLRVFDSGFSDYDFVGSVGEIAIYDWRALTPSQILTHYQSINSGYREVILADNPTCYWRMNQTSGNAIDERLLVGTGG